MKQLLLVAGAAAFAFAAPASADPGNGKGKGNPHAGHVMSGPVGYGVGGCPPGLAKKGCIPPGQAKKLFNVGQRFRLGYGGLTPFGYHQIPYDLRNQYGLNPYGNYYYGNGYLYRVDPTTMIVSQVISAILR